MHDCNISKQQKTTHLAPRRPQLAPERVHDQENHLANPHHHVIDAELLLQTRNGVGVDRRVPVHRELHDEDGGEDAPFLEGREGEAEVVVRVLLGEDVGARRAGGLLVDGSQGCQAVGGRGGDDGVRVGGLRDQSRGGHGGGGVLDVGSDGSVR